MRGKDEQPPTEDDMNAKAPGQAGRSTPKKILRFVTVFPANSTDPHLVRTNFTMLSHHAVFRPAAG